MFGKNKNKEILDELNSINKGHYLLIETSDKYTQKDKAILISILTTSLNFLGRFLGRVYKFRKKYKQNVDVNKLYNFGATTILTVAKDSLLTNEELGEQAYDSIVEELSIILDGFEKKDILIYVKEGIAITGILSELFGEKTMVEMISNIEFFNLRHGLQDSEGGISEELKAQITQDLLKTYKKYIKAT